jgi:hypothetical protein
MYEMMFQYLEKHIGQEDGYFWEPSKESILGLTEHRIQNPYIERIDPFQDGSEQGKVFILFSFLHVLELNIHSLILSRLSSG